MLTNFEPITVEVNDEEKEMAQVIIDRFLQRPGIENAATNQDIAAGLSKVFGVTPGAARVRKLIQWIRVNNLLPGLIATSKGYYFTDSIPDIERWIQSMEERERSMAESRKVAQTHVYILKTREKPINGELPLW